MTELNKLKKLFEKIENRYEREKSPIRRARLLKKAISLEKRITEINT